MAPTFAWKRLSREVYLLTASELTFSRKVCALSHARAATTACVGVCWFGSDKKREHKTAKVCTLSRGIFLCFLWQDSSTSYFRCWYGVATISKMLKNIGLFCKRALQKRPVFCKETCIFKHPTHRSHPIPRKSQHTFAISRSRSQSLRVHT